MLAVALYGDSLALSSIGATLATCGWMSVAPLSVNEPDLAPPLVSLGARVVIFDLAGPHPDAFELWKVCPDLLLIGVDVSAAMALVLSRTCTHVTTTDDLLQVIRSVDVVERTS